MTVTDNFNYAAVVAQRESLAAFASWNQIHNFPNKFRQKICIFVLLKLYRFPLLLARGIICGHHTNDCGEILADSMQFTANLLPMFPHCGKVIKLKRLLSFSFRSCSRLRNKMSSNKTLANLNHCQNRFAYFMQPAISTDSLFH